MGIGIIPDIEKYRSRMAAPMIDKIYFMDKVPGVEVLVDFGCADATMIGFIHKLFPDLQYIGYDISSDMLELARHNAPEGTLLTSNWDEVVAATEGKKSALVLSTVMHEVYSYGSETEINQFWDRVFGGTFDYIAIRELVVSKTTSRPSDPIAVARIRQCYDSDKLDQWESRWGSLNENWSLTHFFLTYRYTENWERELRENYLPLSLEALMKRIPRRYFPIHNDHYTLPFLRSSVEKDFGIQVQDRTHLKLILELQETPQ